jgi:hypothetical protein
MRVKQRVTTPHIANPAIVISAFNSNKMSDLKIGFGRPN